MVMLVVFVSSLLTGATDKLCVNFMCFACLQVVERFTGHYVFCLGLSRFFSCAHWILQVRFVFSTVL